MRHTGRPEDIAEAAAFLAGEAAGHVTTNLAGEQVHAHACSEAG